MGWTPQLPAEHPPLPLIPPQQYPTMHLASA